MKGTLVALKDDSFEELFNHKIDINVDQIDGDLVELSWIEKADNGDQIELFLSFKFSKLIKEILGA